MKRRIAILQGGWSAEREVSLTSAGEVAAALRQRGHEVTMVDVTRDLPALLEALTPPPDVVFNSLHGRGGEDGVIQGVLNMLGLPVTHSGVAASALAMNKPLTNLTLRAVGMPVAENRVVEVEALEHGHPMPPPYVLKPACEGSSFGVRIVRPNDNQPPIDAANWPHGPTVMVENYIPGRELTVGVMGERALAVTEIRHDQSLFDYKAKYEKGVAEHNIPAVIPGLVYDAAMRFALLAHTTLGCRGISRSDFRYDHRQEGTDGLYFLEINTQPGFTPLSLLPEQAAHCGVGFADLCEYLVESAQCPE